MKYQSGVYRITGNNKAWVVRLNKTQAKALHEIYDKIGFLSIKFIRE